MISTSIFEQQGFGNDIGFGLRPALVLVDFTVGFNDPALFGGGNISEAIARTIPLLQLARALQVPVCHTRIVYADDASDGGVITRKVPTLLDLTENSPSGQFVDALMPVAGELVIRKTQASAFFGTRLAGWLISHGADTLVVAGCTTSGCVRATVVDAASANYRTIVAADCCGDRQIDAHHNSLFDMRQKYADVLPSMQIADHLSRTLSAKEISARR